MYRSRGTGTVLELIGGPLDGVLHEIAGGFPVPSRLALPKDGQRHWYESDGNGFANFLHSDSGTTGYQYEVSPL